MNKATIYTLASLLIIISGCGSATKITTSQSPGIINGKKIHLQLLTSSGVFSISQGDMSSRSSAITSDSDNREEKHALLVAHNLAFELRLLGLNLTNSPEDSEVIANFSIGTIRYDPLAGWIADQAFLEFQDSSGQHILTVRAKAKLVTPTVENIVKNLVKELSLNL